jgi:hypothetical protein
LVPSVRFFSDRLNQIGADSLAILGTFTHTLRCIMFPNPEVTMNGLIYLIGLIVVIMFILSFLGLH